MTQPSIKERVLNEFFLEFGPIKDQFEVIDLLGNNSPMDYEVIKYLKLPSEENNIVWHPGVYVFLGNNQVYRVGVSVRNSRARVMQHIKVSTQKNGFSIKDINNYPDKSILLFNIKDPKDIHWLLALELFFERKLDPKIKAGRMG